MKKKVRYLITKKDKDSKNIQYIYNILCKYIYSVYMAYI